MKLNENFIVKDMDNEVMLIPVSQEAVNMNSIFKLNETGKIIFKCLLDDKTEEEIVELLAMDYDVNVDIIRKDVHHTKELLLSKGILYE